MSFDPPHASIYSPEQIDTYLSHISFPKSRFPNLTFEASRAEDGLTVLSELIKYQLAAIPFENLSLHYSQARMVSLDKDDLFQKLVGTRNKRGGYCMENNTFFGTVLRSLGYEVIPTGGRVMIGGDSRGWSHSVNLVFIGGTTYLVDVGFGGNGPTKPLPLVDGLIFDGYISKWGATEAELRLRYQRPSNPVLQGLWILEHRISPSHEWSQSYCFGMTEFVPADFEIMNYATYMPRTSWFTYEVVCQKMILDENQGGIVGVLILQDSRLKKRVFQKTQVLSDFKSEDERIKALEEQFGITLSMSEQAAIKGTVTELKG